MRAAAATLRRVPALALALPRRIRRPLLICLLLALALTGVYRLWFRHSGFVSVQHVTVSGLTTDDAPRIRTALVAAARGMSTLDVQQAALDSAVAGFPVVKAVETKASFPHTLRIRVVEERPAALLLVGGERLLVAADGSVLRGVATGHPLPIIRSTGSVPQDTLTTRQPAAELRVAAAAPAALAGRIESIRAGKRGIFATLRDGPQLFFGNATRLEAKWAAAAAVLADPTSKGATYVDVRLPGRPVAGGLDAQTLAPLTSTGGDASAQSGGQGQTLPAQGTTGAAATAQNPQP